MLRVMPPRLPDRTGCRQGACGGAALLAVATVLLLTGLAARGSSAVSVPVDTASQQAIHLASSVGADGIVGLIGPHHEPAPGQRATPDALPGAPLFAAVTSLLFATVLGAYSPRQWALSRLPMRRGPPWDAFSR